MVISTTKYCNVLLRELTKMTIAITRSFGTVSTEILLAIADTPPINLLVKEIEYRRTNIFKKT